MYDIQLLTLVYKKAKPMLYSILYSVQAYIDYSLSLLGFYSSCVCFLSWWRRQSSFTKRSVWVSTERWIWVSKLLFIDVNLQNGSLHTCSYCMSRFTELKVSMNSANHKLTFPHLGCCLQFPISWQPNIEWPVHVVETLWFSQIDARLLALYSIDFNIYI